MGNIETYCTFNDALSVDCLINDISHCFCCQAHLKFRQKVIAREELMADVTKRVSSSHFIKREGVEGPIV